MPLSDKEQKLLDELELDLVTKDPHLAKELSTGLIESRFGATSYFATMACLIGVVLLIAGIASQTTAVGVIGFLLMGVGSYFLLGDSYAGLLIQPKPTKRPSP
ncbi:DUF3040 domain-containing protein [Arthrobacter sp. FW306-07-I]|uniref:DUF3040 domain-containing protein n=1 Tax=Arthrobacter sp. FW306-07-I TaxID=2879622 RepID=UPI001F34E231|nr:DUF3040 domain-containing protein [Arthrobacter sp. FW306-07-I]UKA77119.1 DUF3040 domain-containing protein [Arthrobacter sp. FW306-07-I]